MFPSNATIGLGLVITAVAAVVDWYVWRVAPVRPYPLAELRHDGDEHDEAAGFDEVA